MKIAVFVIGLIVVGAMFSIFLSCKQERLELKKKDWLVIDVRTAEEFEAGHLKGAYNIPHDQIAEKIGSVTTNKEAPLLLYCRSGRRSGIAQSVLEGLGYTHITNAGAYDNLKRKAGGF